MSEAACINHATHCANCGNPLGENRYNVSPDEGGMCKKRAWCPDCYETLHKLATKDRVERYKTTPALKWDNNADDDVEDS